MISKYIKKLAKMDFKKDITSEQLKRIYANSSLSTDEIKYLKLPKRRSPLDVAANISLPLKSNVLNKIDLSMTPYLIEPISLIGDDSVRFIYIIAPTQSGKTVVLQVAVADTIDQNPGTLLYIYPDENNGKAAMQEKLIGMIKETDFLYKHVVRPEKTNLSTSKIVLDNMTIWPAWAGSIGTLSSKPAKVIIIDEVRLMALKKGAESNAIKHASDRLTTFEAFGQAQALAVSTPSIQGDLMHQQTDLPGLQILHRMLCCQSCDRYWRPVFLKHVTLDNGVAILLCPFCNNKQEEGHLKKLLNARSAYGIPKQHSGERHIPPIGELKSLETLFWFESISSPFRSLQRISKEYETTIGKMQDYRNTVQCWFAEFWIESISRVSELKLKGRIKKGYMRGTVPLGTKYLTGGVDAQDDGFYVCILAWNSGKECHLVDQYKILCHKDTTTWEKTSRILEERLNTRRWDGWMLASWTIDIADGDRTHELMDATCDMERCHRIRGTNSNHQVTNIKYKKDLDYYQVKSYPYLDESDALAVSKNFYLFENVEQDFLNQFVNAKKTNEPNKRTGIEVVIWKKSGQNDYRMAFVYALESLDFYIDGEFTLRDVMDKEGFTYNPAIKIIVDHSPSGTNISASGGKNTETSGDYTSVEEDFSTDSWSTM